MSTRMLACLAFGYGGLASGWLVTHHRIYLWAAILLTAGVIIGLGARDRHDRRARQQTIRDKYAPPRPSEGGDNECSATGTAGRPETEDAAG